MPKAQRGACQTRRSVAAVRLLVLTALVCLQALPWTPATAFGALSRRLAGTGLLLGVASPALAEQLERYVEKDPALPGFQVQRPKGWLFEEQTLKQNMWKDYGRTLKFSQGNLSIEVALQPIDDDKTQLSQLGNPEDFARAFANSASRVLAPPNSAEPSPVPKVTPLSMKAPEDLMQLLAQYRLEVGERPPLIFQQLIGIGKDSEKRNYLYSLTASSPEAEFDRNAKLFADVFQSFRLSPK
mmetsp:Transcript_73290/g.158977  ORF Transcript_73290/g.158977 Transcript_73290/m.158977 type:complete len:241 (-) Transcript_73290:178-900(-)